MRITPEIEHEVARLLTSPINQTELAAYLVENSSLPGPRGNLELLAVVASASFGRTDLIPVYESWLRLHTDGTDPREYLSTVAAASLGSIAISSDPASAATINQLLHTAANDHRWRVREGVAMGLQRIGEADFASLHSILSEWVAGATFLEQRAIAAALAHPPFLKRPGVATEALNILRPIVFSIAEVDSTERKSDEFKTLKQGLSYALSVVVAAAPEPGFDLFKELITAGDRDLIAIVHANLQKNRLLKSFPGEVAALERSIGEHKASRAT